MRIQKLQQEIKSQNIEAYLISHSDEYNSEYVAPYANRIEFITNFTGSVSMFISTSNQAAIFVDGRYTQQAHMQVDTSLCSVEGYSLSSMVQWLESNNIKVLHYSQDTISINFISALQKLATSVILKPVQSCLVDSIWNSKPNKVYHSITTLPPELTGICSKEKIISITNTMKEINVDSIVVTNLDEIAWLLNIRGNDIPFNPLVFGKLIIHQDESLDLYINKMKLPEEFLNNKLNIRYSEEGNFIIDLQKIAKTNKVIGISWSSPMSTLNTLNNTKDKKCSITMIDDLIRLQKQIKNDIEINNIKNAFNRDNQHWADIIKYITSNVNNSTYIDELTTSQQIEDIRSKDTKYRGASFNSIVGCNENSAIIHYAPNQESNKVITKDSIVLIDCGGHYLDGTTDATRTINFSPSHEYKLHYTLVLKGLIALSCANVPRSSTTNILDAFARQFLWQHGLDYPHGTGHGVGNYLNVHEGPLSINFINKNINLKPGMIFSNEPGLYIPGKYGIRLENIMLCKQNEEHKDYLCFESLTYIAFDNNSIIEDMLTKDEQLWLKNYHAKCPK